MELESTKTGTLLIYLRVEAGDSVASRWSHRCYRVKKGADFETLIKAHQSDG